MGSVEVIVVILMLAGWIVWRRWYHGQASTAAGAPQGMSPADLAHKAYMKFLSEDGGAGKPLLAPRSSRPRARRHKGVG
jgi:hypothetical protein